MISNTKIICTIGPASGNIEILKELIDAGMDAARLNFSHSTHPVHKMYIDNIMKARKLTGSNLPIIQDLQGPKIRVGELEKSEIYLETGEFIEIVSRNIKGNEKFINTTYPELINEVKKGDSILLDDGLIRLTVVSKYKDKLRCRIIKGGVLKEHKGINLPHSSLSVNSLTKKDIKDLEFGIKNGIDMVAMSFVRKKEDIKRLRNYMKKFNADMPVISKIERPEAVSNIDEIIKESDAVMIARGDMGVEISPEDVPVIQKKIIAKCNKYYKPVITATQMLESMMKNYIPTRAEAADVANAIIDGTDCVMLSGETSVGIEPVNVVKTMSRIIDKAEEIRQPVFLEALKEDGNVRNDLEIICRAAMRMAFEIKAKAIITLTRTGSSALYLSSHRVSTDIIAVTKDEKVSMLCSLLWGVHTVKCRREDKVTDLVQNGISYGMKKRIMSKGDSIIILNSDSRFKFDFANSISIARI